MAVMCCDILGIFGVYSFLWLVVWNMNFMTSPRVGMVIQSDELIFFKGVGSTTNLVYNLL